MSRASFAYLTAALLAPALLVGAGCASSKIATPDAGVIPGDGAPVDLPFFPPDFEFQDFGPIDVDLGGPIDIDAGWIDVDLGGPIDIDAGPPVICGDGVLTPPEQCDDGNTDPGDGCGAMCEVELDVCPGGDAPRALVPGSTLTGDTSGVASAASGSCGGGTAGEDTFFFTVYDESDVAITTVFPSTVFNAAVYARATCADRATELGCASVLPTGDTLTLEGLAPGTYFAFVDGAGGTSGTYEIGITFTRRIPVGELCEPMGATGVCVDGSVCTADAAGEYRCRSPESICLDSAGTLTLGAPPTGGTTLGAEDRFASTCSDDGDAPERVFRVTVPAGAHDLVVTATPTNFGADMFDIVLTVETMCGVATSDAGCSDVAGADSTEEVVVQNAAGEYFILVDGFGTGPGVFTSGEFEVSARLRDIVAVGGVCDPAGVANRCVDDSACRGGTCSAYFVINDMSPNATFCDAQGPSSGDTLFIGVLTTGGATDLDTIEIRLTAPARLAISTSDGMGGCIADTLVQVFDGTMATCAELDAAMPMPFISDDNSGIGGICSSLTTALLPAGTYYVRVRRPRMTAPGGNYELLVDVM